MNSMPDPCDSAEAWTQIMIGFPQEWKCLVRSFIFFESPTDPRTLRERRGAALKRSMVHFTCEVCGDMSPAFATQKGLDTHMRTKHHQRTCVSKYIDASGICPCCNVNVNNRVRVLRHVAEKRCRARIKYRSCRERILSDEFPEIHSQILEQVFEKDKQLRAAARKQGRTQVLAETHAKRSRWVNQFSHGLLERPITEIRPHHRLRSKRTANEVDWVQSSRAKRRRDNPQRIHLYSLQHAQRRTRVFQPSGNNNNIYIYIWRRAVCSRQ